MNSNKARAIRRIVILAGTNEALVQKINSVFGRNSFYKNIKDGVELINQSSKALPHLEDILSFFANTGNWLAFKDKDDTKELAANFVLVVGTHKELMDRGNK